MMTEDERRAAVAAYRERRIAAGIYAVRCAASRQTWVGRAPNLATIQNRLWFTLRLGSNSHRTLQDAWATHGEAAFSFEVVEQLADEDIAYVRDRMLKEAHVRWAARLQAVRI